jgi:hypothetical protein
MALKNSLILLLLSIHCFGKEFPELLAKQNNENLRLISRDGKYTYYQKKSGSLHFSTNYNVQDVLKGPPGTQYTLFSTSARKKIIVLKNEAFHTYLSLRFKEKIYLINFGESTPKEIGNGISPQLHLNDDWISYYNPSTKTLFFEHTTNSALKFTIKLNAKLNPYFIPQVFMISDNEILYTDLGEKGNHGLIKFTRNLNKTEVIYKENSPTTKIELNACGDQVIIGEFGYLNTKNGSSISFIHKSENDFSKKQTIYTTKLDDIGNLFCDYVNSNLIYFVKDFGDEKTPAFDIAELNLIDKKIAPVTNLKSNTNLINMDGVILSIDRGKTIIVKGENDYKNIDNLKTGVKN